MELSELIRLRPLTLHYETGYYTYVVMTILLANIGPGVINTTVWVRAIAETMIAAYFFYAYL